MVQFSEEPDIILGDGAPSAPPIATAVPATATFNDPNKNIERTTNADGSLSVTVTTTTIQPNGYRNVTIEYFYIPSSMAGTVAMSIDSTGDPPSSLYMTKMEEQVLPPGTGTVVSHAPTAGATATTATIATGTAGATTNPPPPMNATVGSSNNCGKGCAICCAVFCIIVIIIAIAGAVTRSHTNTSFNWPTPAPYNWNPTPPWNPTPIWTPPTAMPTPKGCEDTPNWIDPMTGWDCSTVAQFGYCMSSGERRNCCACGGGSTWVEPTPSPTPTPRPTQPSACKDTPDWKDDNGDGCASYNNVPSMCDMAHWLSPVNSPEENCCVCGGGSVPSSSNSSKAPSTPSLNPIAPFSVSTAQSEMDASKKNPFNSPTASKEE